MLKIISPILGASTLNICTIRLEQYSIKCMEYSRKAKCDWIIGPNVSTQNFRKFLIQNELSQKVKLLTLNRIQKLKNKKQGNMKF